MSDKPIVHFMRYGLTACHKDGIPANWEPGHKWSADWKETTCPACLKGEIEFETFVIEGDVITCKRCNRKSDNPHDVANHFCAYCHVFHDQIWPPARRWWVDHPEPDIVKVMCSQCGYQFGLYRVHAHQQKPLYCPECRAPLPAELSRIREENYKLNPSFAKSLDSQELR